MTCRLPYPGLRSFTREESDLFFGRDGCVDAMVDRLAKTRFLAVLGPSGSGKSSLVRTGLLEALELGLHSSAGCRWKVAQMHPGISPLQNLAAALLRARDGEIRDRDELAYLRQFLGRGPRSVAEWAAGGNVQPNWNLLILVDQFEELFRYGDYAEREEAEAFATLLLETASIPDAKLHVVLTMRSEFLGACSLLPGLAERVNDGIYLTPRMCRDECREAIEGPSQVLGFRVEPPLVTRVLNDLASFAPWDTEPAARQIDRLARRADQLPLMQHVLNRLWIRATEAAAGGETVELMLADYDECGGLSGAIDKHAAAIMEGLGGRSRHVEPIFRALISGTTVAAAVRRPCKMRELVEVSGAPREEVEEIVKAFTAADCSFLRTSDPSLHDDAIVDISHESLIRQWTQLRGWLEKEARDCAEWNRLTTEQQRHAAKRGNLLSGLNLHSLAAWFEDARPTKAWASRHGGDYDEAVTFLERSRRRARQQRNLKWSAVLTALVAIVGGGIVVQSRKSEYVTTKRSEFTALVNRLGETIHDDDVGVIGVAGLQSVATDRALLMQQTRFATRYGQAVARTPLRQQYRLAVALDETGSGEEALELYRRTYDEGIKANQDSAIPDDLMPVLVQNAGRYAWRLFDLGRVEGARAVMRQMERWIHREHTPSDDWHMADAIVHSVLSRYLRQQHQDEAADQQLRHAIDEMKSIQERALTPPKDVIQRPSMDAIRLAYWLQTSLLNTSHDPAVQARAVETACALAKAMSEKNPMDRRAINAQVSCNLMVAARDANRGKIDESKNLLEAALTLAPRDPGLLLLRAQVYNALASWDDPIARDADRKEAKSSFLKVIESDHYFMSIAQMKQMYDAFTSADFAPGQPPKQDPPQFYARVYEALGKRPALFREAPAVQSVLADAAKRVQVLQAATNQPAALPAGGRGGA